MLDLAATGPELVHPAAVGADALRRHVVVGVQQHRGLEVHHLRRERQRRDVADAVDVRPHVMALR
jgi:hypothetical protein